jgi:hypothetical protein
MSELAAFILLGFLEDTARGTTDPHMNLLLSESSLEASTYVMFDYLMKIKLKDLYRFETKQTTKKYDLPINKRVCYIMKKLLKAIEPELFRHLEMLKFEPMICCLRWIRLGFLREFKFEQNLIVWDYLFRNLQKNIPVVDLKSVLKHKTADKEPAEYFDVIDFLCVAVFIHLKPKIMKCPSFLDVVTLVQNLPPVENINEILGHAINAESIFTRPLS